MPTWTPVNFAEGRSTVLQRGDRPRFAGSAHPNRTDHLGTHWLRTSQETRTSEPQPKGAKLRPREAFGVSQFFIPNLSRLMPPRTGSLHLRYLLMASTWHIPTKPERTCVSSPRVSCILYCRGVLMSCSWDGSQTARSCWRRGLSRQQTGVFGLYPSWVATRGN